MTVGTIQRNYIQQNSVGIGFFGYSGWSGWSGQGAIGSGKFLWVDSRLVFNDLNGFYKYYNPSADWSGGALTDGSPFRWAGCQFDIAASTTMTGYTVKMRLQADVTRWNANSGDWYSMRIVKLTSITSSFVGGVAVYSAAVAGAASGYVCTDPNPRGADDILHDFTPINIATPWVTCPGDGYYFVEVCGNATQKFVPHNIYIQFAEVKN